MECGMSMCRRKPVLLFLTATAIVTLSACMPSTGGHNNIDREILWVQTAAEFEALALQAYGAASDDLDKFIADSTWSALPHQHDAADLPGKGFKLRRLPEGYAPQSPRD